jgi:putative transposase
MKHKIEVTYHQVRIAFQGIMNDQIDLKTKTTKCTPNILWDILGLAAVRRQSVSGTCSDLADAPTGAGLFYQLRQGYLTGKELPVLETQMNDLLASQLPSEILRGRHEVAFDLTEIPYHGEAKSDEHEIRRSKAKSGTTHFHVYGSAYLITRHKRVTVAVAYWQAGQSVKNIFDRLMAQVKALSIRIKRLLLDRQFCNVALVSYLQTQPFQTIMPVPARSKRLKSILQTAEESYQTTYTMRSPEVGSVEMPLYVVGLYLKGRYGKHGHEFHLFTVLGRPWRDSISRLGRKFRSRFGIESSYRQMNQARIRTTSRDPAIRFFFITIAFLLLNLWRTLTWQYIAVPRQGGRYVDKSIFRFRTFRNFLADAICEVLPPIRSVLRPDIVF